MGFVSLPTNDGTWRQSFQASEVPISYKTVPLVSDIFLKKMILSLRRCLNSDETAHPAATCYIGLPLVHTCTVTVASQSLFVISTERSSFQVSPTNSMKSSFECPTQTESALLSVPCSSSTECIRRAINNLTIFIEMHDQRVCHIDWETRSNRWWSVVNP